MRTPSEIARACLSWKVKAACAELERMHGDCGRCGADPAKCDEVERLLDARLKNQAEQADKSDAAQFARHCAQTGDTQMCMLAACFKARAGPTEANKAACAAASKK